MRLGTPEIIGILLVVVLLFGPGRIGKIASELGSGIRSFRDGLQGKGKEDDNTDESNDINSEVQRK